MLGDDIGALINQRFGRIGLFALNDGRLRDGSRVLPEDWLTESTRPSPGYEGYGYLWWLRDDDAYSAVGIFGQALHIDPDEELVIVTNSAWPVATGRIYSEHRASFFEALTLALR